MVLLNVQKRGVSGGTTCLYVARFGLRILPFHLVFRCFPRLILCREVGLLPQHMFQDSHSFHENNSKTAGMHRFWVAPLRHLLRISGAVSSLYTSLTCYLSEGIFERYNAFEAWLSGILLKAPLVSLVPFFFRSLVPILLHTWAMHSSYMTDSS